MSKRTPTPDAFMEYFRTNYPGPHTVITAPDWHAPKIYAAAIAASGHADLVSAVKAGLLLFAKDHAIDRFDWGKSGLRAQDIRELNELPGILRAAILKAEAKS